MTPILPKKTVTLPGLDEQQAEALDEHLDAWFNRKVLGLLRWAFAGLVAIALFVAALYSDVRDLERTVFGRGGKSDRPLTSLPAKVDSLDNEMRVLPLRVADEVEQRLRLRGLIK